MPALASPSELRGLRALVFDVDGTLIDTLPAVQAALNEVLQALGEPPLTREAVRERLSQGLPGWLPPHLSAHQPLLLQRYQAHALHLARPYPQAEALLDAARAAGLLLAVCSNGPGEVLQALLQRFAWQAHFAHLVHADNAQALKPEATPLLQALQALGCAPEQAWLVGDSDLDAACAQAAGCGFAWFSQGYGRPAAKRPVALQFDQHQALAERLCRGA